MFKIKTGVNKRAMTDHSVQNNHLIDWERATVEDKENQPVRQEKDAIAIRRKYRMGLQTVLRTSTTVCSSLPHILTDRAGESRTSQ